MMSNAVLAGALTAAYLTILVLHLNPGFPLTVPAVAPLALVMALTYGLTAAVLFFLLIVLPVAAALSLLASKAGAL